MLGRAECTRNTGDPQKNERIDEREEERFNVMKPYNREKRQAAIYVLIKQEA